jgi:AraC-like DNA-binding protein
MQVIQLLERCESLGASSASLRRAAALAPGQPVSADERLPWAAVPRLLSEAERDTRDPLLSLRAGRLGPTRGLLIYQFRSQETLKDSLALLSRNIHLAADPVSLEVREGTHQARILLGVDDAESAAAVREYVTGTILCFVEAVVPHLRPLRISFPHAARGSTAEYERLLGAPVRFLDATCEIAISPDLLTAPIPSANQAVAQMLDAAIEKRLAVHDGNSILPRIEATLEDLLRHGEATTRQQVARRLGVSVRTLQRRLELERRTFRAVRDDMLERSAISLLAHPSLTLDEIAQRLGFADEDGFAKAWKRWTGTTPSEFRSRGEGRGD